VRPPDEDEGLNKIMRWQLIPIALISFVANVQTLIVIALLPKLSATIALPKQYGGLLIATYSISEAISGLAAGPLADVAGKARVLRWGGAVMTLSLVLQGMFLRMPAFIIWRFTAGLAGGILATSIAAYVAEKFTEKNRGLAFGWVAIGMASGQLLGVPLATIFVPKAGFTGTFLLLGLVSAVAVLWFVLGERPSLNAGRLSPRPGLQSVLRVLASRQGTVAMTAALSFLMFAGNGIYVSYLPTWLQTECGFTLREIGQMFFIGGCALLLGSPLAGFLSDHVGRARVVGISCLALALIAGVTAFTTLRPWAAYILFAGAMCLVTARIAPFRALVSSSATDENRGTLIAIVLTMGQIGTGLGAAVSGMLYAAAGFKGTSVAAVILLLLAALITRKLQFSGEQRPSLAFEA
jgi:predicted MFS family arabinose efflux permease